mmetsp:Transcript_14214/g.25252  ORF Transcript_14214/g.25252 Transcript_14214/m.25252 type:complete len:107 (-) Transcript_14214:2027-2347(-)
MSDIPSCEEATAVNNPGGKYDCKVSACVQYQRHSPEACKWHSQNFAVARGFFGYSHTLQEESAVGLTHGAQIDAGPTSPRSVQSTKAPVTNKKWDRKSKHPSRLSG